MDYEESLMIKAAWYYYFEEMTQQHVAELMGITRMRVIKLLEKARQTGIIQFRLRKDGESRMQLERNLMSAFGLQDAFVIPAAIDRSAVNAGVAEAASMYISERLTENSLINIGYGEYPQPHSQQPRHPGRAAAHLRISHRRGQLLSARHPQQRIHAKLHLIPAPLLTGSREMAEALRHEASVMELSRMTALAQMTVVGVGAMHESATIFKSGVLNNNDFLYLSMQGAVGGFAQPLL